MTITPYDNLPVGKIQQTDENTQFQEVAPELPETSEPAESTVTAPEENDFSQDNLEYVDVPVESPAAEAGDSEEVEIPAPAPPVVPKTPAPRRSQDFAKKTTPLSPEPKYSTLAFDNMWGADEFLLPFEETMLVPDTMPDMDEILFSDGRVCVSRPDKLRYEKGDAVSGEITVYTIYRPSGSSSPVDVVSSSISFKTDKCWESCDGASFRAEISIRSISAEMLNERKFTVKGLLCIAFTQIVPRELKIFDTSEDKDLIKREASIDAAALVFEASETTEIAQEINIHEDRPAPSKILRESYSVVETHRQITSGKLVINGTILSSILYLGLEEDEPKLCNLNNKTDFTQFIALDENTDVSLIRIFFSADSLKASIENQNQFMIQGHIDTGICCYENKHLSMVSDAYHKSCELSFDISSQPLAAVEGTVTGEISAREVISIEEKGKKPKTLLCGSLHLEKIAGCAERGRIVINGQANVRLLALDEDESPFVMSAAVPLRGSLEMPSAHDNMTVNISTALKEFWFDAINSRQLEINLSVRMEVWALTQKSFHTIENICSVESAEPQNHIPMAIYVVGTDDSLWDIAKRYKSDISQLALINDIEPESEPAEGTKLFIMK